MGMYRSVARAATARGVRAARFLRASRHVGSAVLASWRRPSGRSRHDAHAYARQRRSTQLTQVVVPNLQLHTDISALTQARIRAISKTGTERSYALTS